MNRAAAIILTIAGACLILLVGWLILRDDDSNYKISKRYDYTDFTAEAYNNRFLAAEKFVQAMQRDATSIETLLQLPALSDEALVDPFTTPFSETIQTTLATTATVIAGSSNVGMSKARSEALLDWVSMGGHLILYAGSEYDNSTSSSEDPLLDYLGVQPYRPEIDEPDPLNTKPGQGFVMPPVFQQTFNFGSELPIRWRDENIYTVNLRPNYYLELQYNYYVDAPVWSAADETGTVMMLFEYREGYITVLSDMGWFTNRQFGEHDHAKLFWKMLHPNGTDSIQPFNPDRPHFHSNHVWLQYLQIGPRWWQLLWDAAWPLVIALAVIVLLLLWMATLRLGPAIPLDTAGRRSLLEHVFASARFRWRWNQHHTLLQQARERLERRVIRRHPAWTRMNEHERTEWLAETYNMKSKAIEFALFKPIQSERDFTLAMQTLQQLESK